MIHLAVFLFLFLAIYCTIHMFFFSFFSLLPFASIPSYTSASKKWLKIDLSSDDFIAAVVLFCLFISLVFLSLYTILCQKDRKSVV